MKNEPMSPKEAAHILMQAEEIKKDPTLMKSVAEVMKDKKKDVKKILSIKELRKAASERSSELARETQGESEEESEEEPEEKEEPSEEVDMSGGVPAAGYDTEKEKKIVSSLGKKMSSV
jgi:hypothetical protein